MDSEKQGANSDDLDAGSAVTNTEVDRRVELLAAHPDRALRLSRILIPTLIEVYSSTVHIKVRQRAIHALLRLMHFISDSVLTTALEVCVNLPMPASYLGQRHIDPHRTNRKINLCASTL
jgi:E3 ubiquitin-protein ligase TRIP12